MFFVCHRLYQKEVENRLNEWCPIKTSNSLVTRNSNNLVAKPLVIAKRQIGAVLVGILWAATDLIQTKSAISEDQRYVDAINMNNKELNKELGMVSSALADMARTLNNTVELENTTVRP